MPSFFDDRPFREASHLNGYSGSRIERWSEARDEQSLADALNAPGAGVYLFQDERPLLRGAEEGPHAMFSRAMAESLGAGVDGLVLLGIAPDGPRFAGLLPADPDLPSGVSLGDLRGLAVEATLDPGELAALAHARSYLFWNATNRFCGRCGGALAAVKGGVSRVCQNCGTEHFPRVDPVVIMLAIDGDRCLLGRQPRFAPGMYSALAGFLEPGETIEEAVRRETKEESGLLIGRVAYHSSQAWPFPSSLMIGCHAEALSTEVQRDAAELEACRWFEREEVRLMLTGEHPDGLKCPPKMAIAHSLIAAFAHFADPL